MVEHLASEIRRIDATLCSLIEQRGRCRNPVEFIHTMESIDHWLDERLVLMRNRDGYQTLTRS